MRCVIGESTVDFASSNHPLLRLGRRFSYPLSSPESPLLYLSGHQMTDIPSLLRTFFFSRLHPVSAQCPECPNALSPTFFDIPVLGSPSAFPPGIHLKMFGTEILFPRMIDSALPQLARRRGSPVVSPFLRFPTPQFSPPGAFRP